MFLLCCATRTRRHAHAPPPPAKSSERSAGALHLSELVSSQSLPLLKLELSKHCDSGGGFPVQCKKTSLNSFICTAMCVSEKPFPWHYITVRRLFFLFPLELANTFHSDPVSAAGFPRCWQIIIQLHQAQIVQNKRLKCVPATDPHRPILFGPSTFPPVLLHHLSHTKPGIASLLIIRVISSQASLNKSYYT